MQDTILRKLSTFSIEYGTSHTKAQLLLLSSDWAHELKDEKPEWVASAFDMHRKHEPKFPTLANIMSVLPLCRTCPKQPALPEAAPREDWGHIPQDIRAAVVRGDVAARQRMEALCQRVNTSCHRGAGAL